MNRLKWRVGALLGLTVFATGTAEAGPNCNNLTTNPSYGIAGNPTVVAASTTHVPASVSGATYCRVDITISEKAGPADGYDVGQAQAVQIRIGLPVKGQWNGKILNLGGAGLGGAVGDVSSAVNAGYVGSSTDTGHTTAENPFFAVIQSTNSLNHGKLKDFLQNSLRLQYQWARFVALMYYGEPATRNYWSGCSTGGRQGLELALKYGNDFDGFLIGAPALFHTRLQHAVMWPQWLNKDVAGGSVDAGKVAAANAAAVAACDAADGVTDGIINNPRGCTFSAVANICGNPGAPVAPNCLTAQEAEVIDRSWDGPRNDIGRKVWFPFDRGANFTAAVPGTGSGSLGISAWNHKDVTFDWRTLPLSQFDDEVQLSSTTVSVYSDVQSSTLDVAKNAGAKILMWHGGADPQIPSRQSVYYYNKAVDYFGSAAALSPWFRYFLAPGVGHCGGGVGPQPVDLLGVLVNWVENGVAPDRILAQNISGTTVTRTRPLCPWPTTAIYTGAGSTDDWNNFECGGDLDPPAERDFVAKYQHETE